MALRQQDFLEAVVRNPQSGCDRNVSCLTSKAQTIRAISRRRVLLVTFLGLRSKILVVHKGQGRHVIAVEAHR
jgi:hypothetical protein